MIERIEKKISQALLAIAILLILAFSIFEKDPDFPTFSNSADHVVLNGLESDQFSNEPK